MACHNLNGIFLRQCIGLPDGSIVNGGPLEPIGYGVIHKPCGLDRFLKIFNPLPFYLLSRSILLNKAYAVIWIFGKPLSPNHVHMVYEWPLFLHTTLLTTKGVISSSTDSTHWAGGYRKTKKCPLKYFEMLQIFTEEFF